MLLDVQTARVQLRPPEHSDVASLFAELTSDVEVARFLSWRVHGAPQETSAFIDRVSSSDSFEGGITRVLRSIERRQVIGLISFRKFEREVQFGICLGQKWWGNGYGTEVVSNIVPAVLGASKAVRAAAYVDPENERSLRMLKACGMETEGRLRKYSVRPNLSCQPRDTLVLSLIT